MGAYGNRQHVQRKCGRTGTRFVLRGSAAGGAIWTDPQVGVTISSSQFVDNEAELAILSSPNGGTVSGGAIDLNPGTYAFPTPPPSVTTITNSVFTGNVAIGTGAAGTEAEGGAINAGEYGDPGGGTITISGSTFVANQALGDSSNINSSDEIGGPAQGGAINSYLNALALTSDTFSANRAVGGSGGTVQTVFGGTVQYALGGAVNNQLYSYYTPFPTLTTTIVDSLFTANQAIGGTGLPSYSNYVEGGALELTDTPASVTNTSFIDNQALGTPATGNTVGYPVLRALEHRGAVETTGAALSIQGWPDFGERRAGRGRAESRREGREAGGYAWGGGIFVGGQGRINARRHCDYRQYRQGRRRRRGHHRWQRRLRPGRRRLRVLRRLRQAYQRHDRWQQCHRRGRRPGHHAGLAGDAQGGGVFEYAATLKISGGLVLGNSAIGGQGGGDGEGGGVFVSGTGANASLSNVFGRPQLGARRCWRGQGLWRRTVRCQWCHHRTLQNQRRRQFRLDRRQRCLWALHDELTTVRHGAVSAQLTDQRRQGDDRVSVHLVRAARQLSAEVLL